MNDKVNHECFEESWIFQPEDSEELWWLVNPQPEEHLRLPAPFADFLKTNLIDVMNPRSISDV